MGTRILCPQCGDKLQLHKPAIDSTRIKCRQCGHKFYAGKAENWGAEEQPLAGGFHPLPGANPAAIGSQQVATQTEMGLGGIAVSDHEPEARWVRRRRQHEGTKYPPWVMPMGVVALVVVALAGIFFSQQSRPETDATANLTDNEASGKLKRSDDKSTSKPTNDSRPPELIGIWETNNPPGGFLDLAADGTVRVHGAFLDQNQIDSTTRWFTVRAVDGTFELEIGPEPSLTTNHVVRLVKQPDGSLMMTRYATLVSMNHQERLLTKKKN